MRRLWCRNLLFTVMRAGSGVQASWRQLRQKKAAALYEEFNAALADLGVSVATGIFQTTMAVELVNEGPVTILLDFDKTL